MHPLQQHLLHLTRVHPRVLLTDLAVVQHDRLVMSQDRQTTTHQLRPLVILLRNQVVRLLIHLHQVTVAPLLAVVDQAQVRVQAIVREVRLTVVVLVTEVVAVVVPLAMLEL